VIPSSVSSMHFRSRSRGELSRLSGDFDDVRSQRSSRSRHTRRASSRRSSVSSTGSALSNRGRRSRLPSASGEPDQRFPRRPFQKRSSSAGSLPNAIDSDSEEEIEQRHSGVFSGLTAMLRSRRSSSRHRESADTTSISRRSLARSRSRGESYSEAEDLESEDAASATDVESDYPEPFGPYESSVLGSSGDSMVSSDESEDQRRKKGIFVTSFGSHGAVGGPDPLFGDSRVDLGSDSDFQSDEDVTSAIDEIGAKGSRQSIYIADEDLHLILEGWAQQGRKMVLWIFACFCTAGILALLGRWIPDWWLSGTSEKRDFNNASFVVARVRDQGLFIRYMSLTKEGNQTIDGNRHVLPIQKTTLPEPRKPTAVFTSTSRTPRSADGSLTPANGNGSRARLDAFPSGSFDAKEAVVELRFIEYRYYRFILHPQTGRFVMSR
jgi:cation-transporting ATPase 13A2